MTSSPQLTGGLPEGSTLAGKYRIERLLGAGGMCFVYEAEHLHLKQSLALKVLKPEFASDPTAVARFAQEAQAAAGLRSPNVARVYDVDRLGDGQPYITMELLVGHDLGTELAQRYSLPMPLAVDYVRQAAQGIAEAHAMGIVHRDLKPENLFLSELGDMTDRKLLKILDFGIAKNVAETSRKLTAPDAVFGTVDYMSPEQIRSASTVDHRTDIWSLGVILFELLTGRTPYVGDARSVIAQIVSDPIVPPSRYVPTLPPQLVAVIMKALAKDPEQRYQNALELRNALTPFVEGIESISNLVARIPPTSIPRRKPSTFEGPPSMRALPDVPRDVRATNLSFETSSSNKGWTKNVTIPAVGALVLLVLAVGIRAFRMSERRVSHDATITAVDPPPPTATLPIQVTTAAPMPVVIAPFPSTTVLPPAALPVMAADPAKSAAAAPPKPKHVAPAKPAAPAHEAPAPAPAPPPTTNPKIL